MNISDLVWEMQHADGWYKNDFAIILAGFNGNIGDETFFKMLIYKAVESGRIQPINSIIDMNISPEERNFLFKPGVLVEWASSKSWDLPQSFVRVTPNKNAPPKFQEIIQYLLKRKFPDLDLIYAGIGDYGQYIDEVDVYLKQLKEKSLIQLLPQYDDERKKEQLELALLAVRDDEVRFFNRPDAKANFIHYCRTITWTKDEALALSFGRDPKVVNTEVLAHYKNNPPPDDPPSQSQFIKDFEREKEILFSDPHLNDTETPKVFLDWFNNNRIPVVLELQKTAVAMGIINAKQFSWMESIGEISFDNDFNFIERAPLESVLQESEKQSLLKMVLGMAMDQYGYVLGANRNKATGEKEGSIKAGLEKVGINLDVDTIRNHLKNASDKLFLE